MKNNDFDTYLKDKLKDKEFKKSFDNYGKELKKRGNTKTDKRVSSIGKV